MGHHAGDALHYHGAPPNRYGHRHPFLSIMHEHESSRMILCAHADQNGEGAHWKREGEPCLQDRGSMSTSGEGTNDDHC